MAERDDLPVLTAETVESWPEVRVFKDDRRSRVSLVEGPDGRGWVLKLFKRPALRQRVARWVGQHPAQRELKANRRLAEAGVPVVPIVASWVDREGRSWLVTPRVGDSVYHWLMGCELADGGTQRRALTRRLGALTGRLLAMKAEHGDYKSSNILVDDGGELHLIDVGAVTSSKGRPLFAAALPMLKTLHENLEDAATYHADPQAVAVTRTDRLRFFRAMQGAWDTAPDGLQHLPRSEEFGR
ncbi:MAG: lipopolysaccharide kinase InaA family protein [Planctomycetota bacterium]